jgi:hypothetical protein
MKTVNFRYVATTGGYVCDKPGDQDGAYVKLEDVKDVLRNNIGINKGLVDLLRKAIDSNPNLFGRQQLLDMTDESNALLDKLLERIEKL